MLNEDASIAATVVREAMANVIEFVDEASGAMPGVEGEKLRREVTEVVLAFIAALITADGQYDPRERAFLIQLVELDQAPNADLGFLRQYTERWRAMEQSVPGFFRVAVDHDVKNKATTARGIMREIQLIGNNCSVTDQKFADSEMKIIRHYLRLLDGYLECRTGDRAAWLEGGAP